MKTLLILAFLLSWAVAAQAAPAILSWTNNATNATGVRVERELAGPTLSFTAVGTVGPTVATFTDTPPTVDLYCYRVLAFLTITTPPINVDSDPSNAVCQKPAGPSSLTIK